MSAQQAPLRNVESAQSENDDEIAFLSANELVDLYRAKKLSPVDVTQTILNRIDRLDRQIRSYAHVDAEQALAAARQSEQRWLRAEPLGIVDGVPVALKDLILAKGWPTLRGSRAVNPDQEWSEDSPATARLREQGAILLGKTTTSEFGWKALGDSPVTGITRNPWNLAHTPGGSSGGSAAAAAAGFGPLHVATGGAGSTRLPAAHTGTFGFKPTFGRVPVYPTSQNGTLFHVTPLTRTVRDAALLLDVISRPDGRDWTALPFESIAWGADLEKGIKGFRIAFSMSVGRSNISLELPHLAAGYQRGALTPARVVMEIFERIEQRGEDGVWISLTSLEEARARTRELESISASERSALWGVPFSIKDCIDVTGWPTTSACPDFSYVPDQTNPAVARLLAAGAILIGKTNMDQFATGLVGVRTPYGVARNPFNAEYIPGGSSSGAAVSVAEELVSFALGTDTGGSGRVPAAFNNVVGLKPTRGLVSGVGVVPACRSIETISIFALTVADAQAVFDVVRAYDENDPFSRNVALFPSETPERFRFGVPADDFLDFFGNDDAANLFAQAAVRLESIGGERIEIDYSPFLEINDLLFRGPWLAERYGALRHIVDHNPAAIFPVTHETLLGGRRIPGTEVFAAQQRLQLLRRKVDAFWKEIDALVVPTTGTIFRLDELRNDPFTPNTKLGRYTNFVNLADLAAVAVPSGFLPNGLPQGVTFTTPAFADRRAAAIAERFHRAAALPLGARGAPLTHHSHHILEET